eukprot:m.59089 g.59089  ORF g.59089 m.59089 type:complete len:94 (+) comp11303_c0_seq3:715-996(+)
MSTLVTVRDGGQMSVGVDEVFIGDGGAITGSLSPSSETKCTRRWRLPVNLVVVVVVMVGYRHKDIHKTIASFHSLKNSCTSTSTRKTYTHFLF